MKKIKRTEDNIYQMYLKQPDIVLVKNVKALIASYWILFDGVKFPLSLNDFYQTTTPETITRACRNLKKRLKIDDDLADKLEAETHYHFVK